MPEIPVARAGSVDRSYIRVKAFAIILDETGERHVVSRAQHQDGQHWHRLLGGSIDLGERSADAVVREIREELGATLLDLEFLGVLENVFTLDGELGHEVVFVPTAPRNCSIAGLRSEKPDAPRSATRSSPV